MRMHSMSMDVSFKLFDLPVLIKDYRYILYAFIPVDREKKYRRGWFKPKNVQGFLELFSEDSNMIKNKSSRW
jgi:hypothetical protein